MNHSASHELVLLAAGSCAWPAVTIDAAAVGRFSVEGEGPWRRAVAASTPADRLALVVALGPSLLTSTEGGRARLEAAKAPPCERDAVDPEPSFFGDPELLPLVRAALALMPEVAAWAVLRETAFLAVGTSSRAWCSRANFVHDTGRLKERVIVLGPAASIMTILHEAGHIWCVGPPREVGNPVTVQGEAGFLALAAREDWGIEVVDDGRALSEALADALAFSWAYGRDAGRLA